MKEIILSQIPEIQKVNYNEYEYMISYSNNVKVLFNDASEFNNHLMAIEKDDTLLRFSLDDASPKETLINNNLITYPNAFNSVDLQYEILDSKVKETLIIKDKSAKHSFNFSTLDNNVNYRLLEDGSIEYVDIDDVEEKLWTIEAPYAFDANNNEVEVLMTNGINGYSLEAIPNEDTVYPIYLDPTIYISGLQMALSYLSDTLNTATRTVTFDFEKMNSRMNNMRGQYMYTCGSNTYYDPQDTSLYLAYMEVIMYEGSTEVSREKVSRSMYGNANNNYWSVDIPKNITKIVYSSKFAYLGSSTSSAAAGKVWFQLQSYDSDDIDPARLTNLSKDNFVDTLNMFKDGLNQCYVDSFTYINSNNSPSLVSTIKKVKVNEIEKDLPQVIKKTDTVELIHTSLLPSSNGIVVVNLKTIEAAIDESIVEIDEITSDIIKDGNGYKMLFEKSNVITEDFEDSNYNLDFTGTSWSRRSEIKYSGSYAGYIGTTANNATLASEATVKASNVSFRWGVSSEYGKDIFRFYIDGTEKLNKSGSVTRMELAKFDLDPNKDTTLRWEYKTDSRYYKDYAGFFIDDLVVSSSEKLIKSTLYTIPVDTRFLKPSQLEITLNDLTITGSITTNKFYSIDNGSTWIEFNSAAEIPKRETIFKVEFEKPSIEDTSTVSFTSLTLGGQSGPVEIPVDITIDTYKQNTISTSININTIKSNVTDIILLSDTERLYGYVINLIAKTNRYINTTLNITNDLTRQLLTSIIFNNDSYKAIIAAHNINLDTSKKSSNGYSTILDTNRIVKKYGYTLKTPHKILSTLRADAGGAIIPKDFIFDPLKAGFNITKLKIRHQIQSNTNNAVDAYINDKFVERISISSGDVYSEYIDSNITKFGIAPKSTHPFESIISHTSLTEISYDRYVYTVQGNYTMSIKNGSMVTLTNVTVLSDYSSSTQSVPKYLTKVMIYDKETNAYLREENLPFTFDSSQYRWYPGGLRDGDLTFNVYTTTPKDFELNTSFNTSRITSDDINIVLDTNRSTMNTYDVNLNLDTSRYIKDKNYLIIDSVNSNIDSTGRITWGSLPSIIEDFSNNANLFKITGDWRRVQKFEGSYSYCLEIIDGGQISFKTSGTRHYFRLDVTGPVGEYNYIRIFRDDVLYKTISSNYSSAFDNIIEELTDSRTTYSWSIDMTGPNTGCRMDMIIQEDKTVDPEATVYYYQSNLSKYSNIHKVRMGFEGINDYFCSYKNFYSLDNKSTWFELNDAGVNNLNKQIVYFKTVFYADDIFKKPNARIRDPYYEVAENFFVKVNLKLDTKLSKINIINTSSNTNRKLAINNNFISDTFRFAAKKLSIESDTFRYTNKTLTNNLDTTKITHVSNKTAFDTKVINCVSNKLTLDTTKITNASKTLNIDTSKSSVVNASIKLDSNRYLVLLLSKRLDTLKTTVSSASLALNTLKTSIKSCKLNSDTLRLSNKALNLALNTKRTIKSSFSVLINLDTVRSITKQIKLYSDTNRILNKEFRVNITIDTNRKITRNASINSRTRRRIIKAINILNNTKLINSISNKLNIDALRTIIKNNLLKANLLKITHKALNLALDTYREAKEYIPTTLNLDTNREILDRPIIKTGINFYLWDASTRDKTLKDVFDFDLMKFKITRFKFEVQCKNQEGYVLLDGVKYRTKLDNTGAYYTYEYIVDKNAANIPFELFMPKNTISNTLMFKITEVETNKSVVYGESLTTNEATCVMPYNARVIPGGFRISESSSGNTRPIANITTVYSGYPSTALTLPQVFADKASFKVKAHTSTDYPTFAMLPIERLEKVNLSLNTIRQVRDNTTMHYINLNLNTDRKVDKSIEINSNTNRSKIRAFDAIKYNLNRKVSKNINSKVNTKRLIAINKNIVLDTSRVYGYRVELKVDTRRESYRSNIKALINTSRKISAPIKFKLNTLRPIRKDISNLYDTNREVVKLIKVDLRLDTNREVYFELIANYKYDLIRRVSKNINANLDTFKINALNSIYNLDTQRTKENVIKINSNTNRSKIKDINALNTTKRIIANTIDLELDSNRSVLLKAIKLNLDTARKKQNKITVCYDTKRGIFMPMSLLSTTLEVDFKYEDSKLIYLKESYKNLLDFEVTYSDEYNQIKVEFVNEFNFNYDFDLK